ncbi:MAG TPA: NAD(P)H-dependent oxidoreductase subunit E [Anaerolineales bacterium]|nr:NAD(P)H-dependent oxidoreductase subunit E [Anaerolineales bacterium]
MNAFQQKYATEIEAILSKYPADRKRSAVMPLLYIAQREGGYVTKKEMSEIAEILDITPTEVASIIGFYTLYHEKPGGKYRIQVCNDLPCALRGADEFLEKLCENVGIQVGETTEDGLVTIEGVMCLAACDKAPMFQVQTGEGIAYHEDQTLESTMALIESWKQQEKED